MASAADLLLRIFAKNDASGPLNKLEQQLKGLSGHAGHAGKSISDALQKTGMNLQMAGMSMSMALTAPIVGLGALATKTALDFETGFAGVIKTVDATKEELAELRQGFRDLAKEIPVSAVELTRIGEAAGQLGVATPNILGFTRVMADLGQTTNMTSDEAATALARIANITQMSQTNFDRLGSTVVDLGNKFASTEREIVDMSLRLAGAGHAVGMSEAQILGFANALSSVGVEAQMGGTSISRVMIEMANEVASGGEKLGLFAAVAGKSASDFQRAFKQDAAGAIIDFIGGLGRIQAAGGNVFAVLDALGLSEIRVRDALLRAAGAGDLFARSQDVAKKAWKENNALTIEAAKRYETSASKLTVFWNRLKDVAITLGDALLPALNSTLDAAAPLVKIAEKLAQGFADLPKPVQSGILAFLGMVAVLGPVVLYIGFLASAIGSLIPLLGVMGAGLGVVAAVLGSPVVLAIAAVAVAIVGLGYAWSQNWGDIQSITRTATADTSSQVHTMSQNIRNETDGMQSHTRQQFGEIGADLDTLTDRWQGYKDKVAASTSAATDDVRVHTNLTRTYLDREAQDLAALTKRWQQYKDSLEMGEPHRTPTLAEQQLKDDLKLGLDYMRQQVGSLKEDTIDLGEEITKAFDSSLLPSPEIESAADRIKNALRSMADAAKDRFDALRDTMSGLKDRLNDLVRTPIRGEGAFSDKMFGLEQQINKLALQKVTLQLSNAPKRQIDSIDKQMETLRLQLEKLRLQASIRFDPLRRQIDKLADPVKEMPFGAIITGIRDTMQAQQDLQPQLAAAENRWKLYMDQLRNVELQAKDTASALTEAVRAAQGIANLPAGATTPLTGGLPASAFPSAVAATGGGNNSVTINAPLIGSITVADEADEGRLVSKLKDMLESALSGAASSGTRYPLGMTAKV